MGNSGRVGRLPRANSEISDSTHRLDSLNRFSRNSGIVDTRYRM